MDKNKDFTVKSNLKVAITKNAFDVVEPKKDFNYFLSSFIWEVFTKRHRCSTLLSFASLFMLLLFAEGFEAVLNYFFGNVFVGLVICFGMIYVMYFTFLFIAMEIVTPIYHIVVCRNRIAKDLEEDVDGLIHYTTVEGCKGILETGVLYQSNYASSYSVLINWKRKEGEPLFRRGTFFYNIKDEYNLKNISSFLNSGKENYLTVKIKIYNLTKEQKKRFKVRSLYDDAIIHIGDFVLHPDNIIIVERVDYEHLVKIRDEEKEKELAKN